MRICSLRLKTVEEFTIHRTLNNPAPKKTLSPLKGQCWKGAGRAHHVPCPLKLERALCLRSSGYFSGNGKGGFFSGTPWKKSTVDDPQVAALSSACRGGRANSPPPHWVCWRQRPLPVNPNPTSDIIKSLRGPTLLSLESFQPKKYFILCNVHKPFH